MASAPVKCKACGEDCTSHYFMCDWNCDDNDVWCPKCFDKTPCGKGEHGEGCPTQVFETPSSRV